MKVYLVRHGESMANKDGMFYGRFDSPLSPKGWEQARAVHEKLKHVQVQKCFISPLQRAADTGRTVAEGMHIPIIVDERLIEGSLGEWEMKTVSEVFSQHPELAKKRHGWANYPYPGGERGEDIINRVRPFAREIIKANENVMIAAHYGTIRALMACFLKQPAEFMDHVVIEQGVYTLLDLDGDYGTIEVLNG